jgi:hypothetical protein
MKKNFLTGLTALALSIGLVLAGCEGPTGADGAPSRGGTPGDTILSGTVSEAAVRYALASGAPVVFAGATLEANLGAPLVIDRAVTLIANSPALSTKAGDTGSVIIITAIPAGTGTITAGTIVGTKAVLDKAATPGVVRIEASTGGPIHVGTDTAVAGNITISSAVTNATNIINSASITNLYVIGNLTVNDDVSSIKNINVTGTLTVATGKTLTLGSSGAGSLIAGGGANIDKLTVGASNASIASSGTVTVKASAVLGGALTIADGTFAITDATTVTGSGTVATSGRGAIAAANVTQLETLLPRTGAANLSLAASGSLSGSSTTVSAATTLTIPTGVALTIPATKTLAVATSGTFVVAGTVNVEGVLTLGSDVNTAIGASSSLTGTINVKTDGVYTDNSDEGPWNDTWSKKGGDGTGTVVVEKGGAFKRLAVNNSDLYVFAGDDGAFFKLTAAGAKVTIIYRPDDYFYDNGFSNGNDSRTDSTRSFAYYIDGAVTIAAYKNDNQYGSAFDELTVNGGGILTVSKASVGIYVDAPSRPGIKGVGNGKIVLLEAGNKIGVDREGAGHATTWTNLPGITTNDNSAPTWNSSYVTTATTSTTFTWNGSNAWGAPVLVSP